MPELRGLNLGSGPDWRRPGWETTDHKANRSSTAWRIESADETFDLVFSSHMIEHIPHFKIDEVLSECNRVLRPGGGLRLVCPDLEAFARAYVAGDQSLFDRFVREDPTIRRDLGLGGMLMNFIVSPGADNLLFSRNGECIGGYAHIYSYDYDMLRRLLERHGFSDIQRRGFCESDHAEFREPLHPIGAPCDWRPLIEWGDRSQGITGFDRNPLTSLIVEARKARHIAVPATRFGTPGERGLDANNFDWINVTRGYLRFTAAKARSFARRVRLKTGRNAAEALARVHHALRRLASHTRRLAGALLPRSAKEALKRVLGWNRPG